jgi:hypothetical protein
MAVPVKVRTNTHTYRETYQDGKGLSNRCTVTVTVCRSRKDLCMSWSPCVIWRVMGNKKGNKQPPAFRSCSASANHFNNGYSSPVRVYRHSPSANVSFPNQPKNILVHALESTPLSSVIALRMPWADAQSKHKKLLSPPYLLGLGQQTNDTFSFRMGGRAHIVLAKI